MSLYLKNISLEEAINKSKEVCSKINLKTEMVNTWEALGRVTSRAHYANVSSPHFTASAMDGIATCFKYTEKADINNPVTLTKDMYEVVDTGDPVNHPFDCVIMIEDVVLTDKGCTITKPSTPYDKVRPIGEDIQKGEIIVPRLKKITAIEMSSLLAAKITKVEVFKEVTVGIIPTGDEIIDAREVTLPEKGELIDYNSWTFKALIDSYGGKGVRYDIVKDNKENLKKAVLKAASECDMVILNAGSSKGRGDYSVDVVEELGEKFFHGIDIKPGKPTSLGLVNETPIFGVPGYPVSAFFIIESLVKPGIEVVLNKIQNVKNENKTINAVISKKVSSSPKRDEFVRVKLGKVGDKVVASPLGKGGSTTMSLTNADGYFVIPKDNAGFEASSEIKINILKDDFNLDKTLIFAGGHDIAIDVLKDFIKSKDINLTSTNVGSLEGIMALKKGETHIAPINILGEKGDYNIDYCKKHLDDFVIIKFVKRVLGFAVQKGNPLNITNFNDLSRVSYVNRQKGSGTRLFLDYNLEKNDINKSSIKGYDREEITNLGVAAQVKGKVADTGLCTQSAANIMELDFVPVCTENYDFVLKRDSLEDYRVKELLNILKSSEFKNKLDEIGGYNFSEIGEVIF